VSKIYTKQNGTFFQNDRDVNATRVKSLLHIFTGTYPLYYKGDGKLYAYPRYLPDPIQILRFGHNIMSDDFELQYRFNDSPSVSDNLLNPVGSKSISLKEIDKTPVFLSENEPTNLEVSYNYSRFHEDEITRFLPENYVTSVATFGDLPENSDVGEVYYVRDTTSDFVGFYSRGTTNVDILFNRLFSAQGFSIPSFTNVEIPFQFPVDPRQLKVFSKAASTNGTQDVLIYDGSKLTNDMSYTGETVTVGLDTHTYTADINAVQAFGELNVQIPIRITRSVNGFSDGVIYFQVTRSDEDLEEIQNTNWDISFGAPARNTGNQFKTVDEVRLQVVTTEDNWARLRYIPAPLREITLKIYQRPAAVLGTSPVEWEEVEDYTSTTHSNGNFTSAGMRIVSPDTLFNEISAVTPADEIIAQPKPLEATINTLPVANHNWDFKIEIVERLRRYEELRVGPLEDVRIEYRLVDREVIRASKIYYDVLVSLFRLSDFPTEDNPNRTFSIRAAWSANKVLEHFGKLLVYGSKEMPDNVFISAPEDVSLFYFPHLFRKEFLTDSKETLESVVPFSNILVAQTPNRTWGIKGNSSLLFLDEDAQVENPDAYRLFDVNTGIGTIAYKTVRPVRNQLYFLSNQGLMSLISLYATDDKYNVRPLDRNINNIVPSDKKAIGIQHDNQYWINFPSTGQTFRYYIDNQAWMKDSFENFEESNGWLWVNTKDGVLRFLTRAMVLNKDDPYSIYEGIVNKGLPTDFGKNIKSMFLTANLDQDQPFHTKRYRELKFSFALQNQFLPPLKPIPNTVSKSNNDYIVQFKGTRYHTYNVEFSLPNNTSTYAATTPIEYNIEVLNVLGESSESLTFEKKENNSFDVFLGNYEGPVFLTVRDTNGNVIQDEDVVVTDVTYDFNIEGFTLVDSDGNTINRVPFVQFESQKEAFDQSLGTRFSQFELGRTPFGDIKRNVQTIRLSGSGYQIAILVEDESRSKWTLETLGIQFRMRKTRSR